MTLFLKTTESAPSYCRRRGSVFACCTLLLSSWSHSAEKVPDTLIQIGIAHRVSSLSIRPYGKFTLIDAASGQSEALTPDKSYRLQAEDRKLRFGPLLISSQARLKPENPTDTVAVGKKIYQGSLILQRNSDETVTVIDELGIEDYLLGVLPHEMDVNWPLEALKAQAVVARTFAYSHLGKYRGAGFDLTPDTRSQMFGGIGPISKAVQLAVSQTRGEVLGYKGQLLTVFYHAACGGHTTDPASIWGASEKTPAPLRGVRDRTCAASPYGAWTAYFPYEDILGAIQGRNLIAGKIKSFKIGRRDKAGYAKDFKIKIDSEEVTVGANDFRNKIGNSDLKSTRIKKIAKRRNGIEFFGSGLGHGAGLCQWGARLQAGKGRQYEKILKFYYPGSVLSLVTE